MGSSDYCCVGPCGNCRRRPESQKVQSHASTLRRHCLPKDPAKRWQWVEQIRSGRRDFNPTENTTLTKACSNHFPNGEPTTSNLIPVLFMTPSEVQLPLPKKRRTIQKHHSPPQPLPILQTPHSESKQTVHHSFLLCTASLQLSRNADVKFYTGFNDTTQFKYIFDQLLPKAEKMQCWRGTKQTDQETPSAAISADFTHAYARPGPSQKLRLEQELLLIMMRLRVGLMVHDLAFRFQISTSTVSSIFNTWIILMRLELAHLIMWPSKQVTWAHLPSVSKNTTPKCDALLIAQRSL